MKFQRRRDPNWLHTGDCQFYFFQDPSYPCCFVTNAIVRGDANVFESNDEAMHFIDCDCKGKFENCPYTPALWDFSGGPSQEVDLSEPLVVKGSNPTIEIVFGWPYPIDPEEACDALVIPTNTYLRFVDLLPTYAWNFSDESLIQIMDEVSSMERPKEVGEVVSTNAAGTPYGLLVHGVVAGLGGQPTDNVTDVVLAGLKHSAEIGASSVAIHPMCLMMGNTDGLAQTLFGEIKAIERLFKIQPSNSIQYIRLYLPPIPEAYQIAAAVMDVIN